MSALQHLVAEAAALAGGHLCVAGHDWQSIGGRQCGHDDCDGRRSQTVYQCARCGGYDHGEPGGPAHAECSSGACGRFPS